MSYTFRVIFEGVLGYIPDKPFFVRCCKGKNYCCTKYRDQASGATKKICYNCDPDEGCWKRRSDAVDPNDPESGPIRSLAVLLPDLRRPGVPSVPGSTQPCPHCCPEEAEQDSPRLNFPKFREPHFPLLSFRLSDLRESTTRRIDLVARDISRQEEEGLLFLRREQIRFKMVAENAETFSFAGWAPCPPPPPYKLPDCCDRLKKLPEWWGRSPDLGDREQLESLWWLPDLERIVLDPAFQKATRARHDILPSYRGPFPEGLVARVECTGGRLRTYDFNRGVDGFPFRWRFAKPEDAWGPGSWNRALANSLALEFFDVRDEVRIELKRLANEVVVEELVLAPAPGASRPVLEICISNREPDLLFQEESFNRSSLPDMDFQPFYEQLSEASENDWAKLPIPNPGTTSFFGPVEKPCSGTVIRGQGGTDGQ